LKGPLSPLLHGRSRDTAHMLIDMQRNRVYPKQ